MKRSEAIKRYAQKQSELCIRHDTIDNSEFEHFRVYRGLRDLKGRGVRTGLTNISKIISFDESTGERIPCDGQLWYRGYRIEDLVKRYSKTKFGYEYLTYLLLFGELPTEEEAEEFIDTLSAVRDLPKNFTRDVIMKGPSRDIMNSMTSSILTLAAYDHNAHSTEVANVVRQSLNLIAVFPMLAIYGYHAYNYYENMESMYIHRPDPEKSTAENVLLMLRPDRTCTETEAMALDAALMLHMEHGGGNNSTFTTRVVTSAGSDTYATIAAAMSSLKGPRHGGANIKVIEMINNIKENVKDWEDEDEIADYLGRILEKEVFDHAGLIYGMGHAVYSVSDPRERIFKNFVLRLSEEKGRQKDMNLYNSIEKIAPKVIAEKRHIYKGVSPNVDFYSGFAYDMLNIPMELYTPIFAIARIAGWSSHRIEEIVGDGKIIRPAYISVMEEL